MAAWHSEALHATVAIPGRAEPTRPTQVTCLATVGRDSVWKAPSSKSQSVNILTYTTWTVGKVSEGGVGGLKVLAYEIDRLDFAPGTSQQTPH